MENWDYALLSQRAKAVGGPEKLVEELFEQGRQLGVRQTWEKIGIGAGITGVLAGLGLIIYAIAKRISRMKNKDEENKLKNELIQGIKEYDRQQELQSKTENDDTE